MVNRAGEVPSIEWRKDFETWEGLGGWIVVNLVCGWRVWGCVCVRESVCVFCVCECV